MACATRCQPLLPILTTLQWGGPLPFIYKQLGVPGFPADFSDGLRGPLAGPIRAAMKRGGLVGKPVTSGGSPGGPGGGCVCSSTDGSLKIVCCGTGGCAFDCSPTSNPQGIMVLGACGGEPPYIWSLVKAGGGTIAASGSNQATLTKPANTGSGEAGDAYTTEIFAVGFASSCVSDASAGVEYGCNDQVTAACHLRALKCGVCDDSAKCSGTGDTCTGGGCQDGLIAMIDGNETCATCSGTGTTCDLRTPGMIAAGCNPCKAAMAGTVVTVTDSLGVSVSKTI